MAKTGRPKIDPKSRKRSFLTVRLSDAEREEIDRAAERAKTKPTKWGREILLAKARESS